jgi:4-alpha-glucanotransferase
VEINALWFNALSVMAQFAEMLKLPSKLYVDLAARARAGFQRFLDPAGGLFDVLDTPEGDDATVRPNQIFAVSLPFSPLDRDCQAKVVRACGRELLTSYGLRSLSPSDRNFHPYYTGGVWKRDGGYHQGPVWAFLLGHYALAEHRITGDAAMAQARLDPLRDHLLDAALGSVSEIFDGAPPHTPRARRLRRGRSHARSKRGGGWSRRNGIPSPWTPIRARPPRKNPKRGRRATASGGIQPLEIPLTVPI